MKGIKEIKRGNNGIGLEFTSRNQVGCIDYEGGAFKFDSNVNIKGVDITPTEGLKTSSGVVSQPTISYNIGLGTVTLGNGTYRFYHTLDYSGMVSEYEISGETLSFNDKVTSYVIAQYNNGSPQLSIIEDITTLNDSINCIIYTIYRDGDNFSVIDWDEPGLGLSNKLHRRLIETERFARVYGFDISEYGTRNLLVSGGKVWEGAKGNSLLEVNSVDDQYILWINNGDGSFSWSEVTQYSNTGYDPKTGSLSILGDGEYGVIWLYRSMSIDSKTVHMILGNQGYDLNGAKAAQPVEVPQLLNTNSVLIGKVIVLKNNPTAAEIDSAFSTTFAGSVTTNHGGLTGLSGGHNGVYNHLPIYNEDGITPILSVDNIDNIVYAKNIDSPISNYLGNGVLTGFTISINVDNTKIDIASGTGNIIDHSDTTNPIWTNIDFAGVTGLTLTNLATANATYLAIDSLGEVIQQTTPFTATQRGGGLIIIGAAIHSNRTNVNVVNNLPDVVIDQMGQYNELLDGLHNFNVEGNIFSANGANFNINKSVGKIFKRGSNFENDINNPHIKDLPALVAPTNLRYRLQDGTEYSDTDVIDNLYYDNSGVRTVVPNNKWTVQRITIFPSNIIRIQYGQSVYGSSAEAIQSISTDNFVTESNIGENGLLRCLLVVGQANSDLTDAIFLKVGRFGGTETTGAGSAVTNLQQAYNNSITPEIVTDATRGALSLKQGSGSDSDVVLEVLNGAGSQKIVATGEGRMGIGTTDTTRAGLSVYSYQSFDNGAYGYLNNLGQVGTSVGSPDTSIFAIARIVGSEINAVSDERVKTRITPIENALDVINKLNVVGYNKRIEGSDSAMGEVGLIAQELKEVYPLAIRVSEGRVPDENGEWKDVDDFHQVNYQTMFSLSLKAIQELTDRIEVLERKINM